MAEKTATATIGTQNRRTNSTQKAMRSPEIFAFAYVGNFKS
ncbi:hypothetical protein [Dendronalium sp. ChiSLP03b]|nr:hypothetical protein [Dendronalium sp. ChiSLP03b]MDZ8208668.1 hypothetical protein [Dendronalium sp. ChiSLP03b]